MSSIPIIGLGAVSCAGNDIASGKQSVYTGKDGLTPLSLFDSGLKTAPLCGQVQSIPKEFSAPNKTAALANMATAQALSSIADRKNLKLGFVCATTVGGMTNSELFYKQYKADPTFIAHAADYVASHEPAALSGFLCKQYNGSGFHTLSTACSTGLHAAGIAMRLVENGTYDLCCAVGSDALAILTLRGFASLMLLDATGCKPFDKQRAGTSLGEGAGAILFASKKTIDKLGTKPLAYMRGWGASADCHHMTAPHPQGLGAQNAVRTALGEANLLPNEIDMIAAHGTATPDNDIAEINAMKAIFGTVPPFFSLKRTLGHTLAASGIIDAVYAITAMQDSTIPGTPGFSLLDDAIGLAPSQPQTKQVLHVLKNAFGFGGNNASAVFSLKEGQ